MAAIFYAWCVVATDDTFEAREIPYERLDAPNVLAIYPDRRGAEDAVKRIIAHRESLDDRYEPIFQRERMARMKSGLSDAGAREDSIRRELTVRNKMIDAVRKIAQPRDPTP